MSDSKSVGDSPAIAAIRERYTSRSQVRRVIISDASQIHRDIAYLLDLLDQRRPETTETSAQKE